MAKAEGYGGVLEVCYVINQTGEIVKYATLEQHEEAELEYMNSAFGTLIDYPEYSDKIVGKTTASITENDVLIAGSTFTSNATKACFKSIMDAHNIINGGAK